MEKLLNKLIERGWRPFDVKGISEYFFESVPVGMYRLCWKKPDYDYNVYSKREIVSKESGLWQFVCENKLVKTKDKKVRYMYEDIERTQNYFSWYGYEYRLIESALKDESELEQFLLNNIKI